MNTIQSNIALLYKIRDTINEHLEFLQEELKKNISLTTALQDVLIHLQDNKEFKPDEIKHAITVNFEGKESIKKAIRFSTDLSVENTKQLQELGETSCPQKLYDTNAS